MDELLDNLARHTNCFISDLRSETNFLKIKTVLISLEDNSYSLIAWQNAYHYIIGTYPVGDTVGAIKQEMIQQLKIE